MVTRLRLLVETGRGTAEPRAAFRRGEACFTRSVAAPGPAFARVAPTGAAVAVHRAKLAVRPAPGDAVTLHAQRARTAHTGGRANEPLVEAFARTSDAVTRAALGVRRALRAARDAGRMHRLRIAAALRRAHADKPSQGERACQNLS
jgi:hypothetical protein